MSESTTRSNRTENILLVVFGLIFVLSLCGVIFGVMYAFESPAGAYMLPICVTPLALAVGAFVMTWMRHILRVPWRYFWWAMGIWCVGIVLFGFGGFAIISSNEPNQIREDILFGIALCLLPGALLMLGGTAMYATGYSKRDEDEDAGL